jgi:hypothetical protein
VDSKGFLTSSTASKTIEALLALPKANGTAPAASKGVTRDMAKPNRRAQNCEGCGVKVEAGEGVLELSDGKWLVFHIEGECPVSIFLATDGTEVPSGRYALTSEGEVKFYRLAEGRIFAQASDELHPINNATTRQAIVDAIALDIEGSARLYGQEIGECCRCGRGLTSAWRKEGIGPKCFEKSGW